MVLCFVLLLSSIHYMYDYIKHEFTETREVPTFNDYIKKDIYDKDNSYENAKSEKGEKKIKKQKAGEKMNEKSSENWIEKQHLKEKDIKEEENKKEEKEEKTKDMLPTEQDYTPIYQLKKPIEEMVDHTVYPIPIISSVDHVEDKKETNELDDYFKSLH